MKKAKGGNVHKDVRIKEMVKEATTKPIRTAFNPVLRERDMGRQAMEDGAKEITPFLPNE